MSDFPFAEWFNLAVRWTHVFAGILWVGQTYLFTSLDGRFAEGDSVWVVHSFVLFILTHEEYMKGKWK